jgi:hypothetical protein
MRGTATRPERDVSVVLIWPLRAACMAFAATTIAWVCFVISPLWAESQLRDVTDGIVSAATFKPEVLASLDPTFLAGASTRPYPDLVRTEALVRLRQAELANNGNAASPQTPAFMAALDAATRAVSVAPSDSYLWFGLYWLAVTTHQPDSSAKPFLSMSYRTGPNEGWIAARRNPMAFRLYPVLDADTRFQVVTEFQNLAMSQEYVGFLALTLSSVPEASQKQLLSLLANTPEENRKSLSNMLFQLGVDTPVPGIVRGDRPWD